MGDDVALMWRDVTVIARGAPAILVVIFGLPLASALLVALRQWLALLPLVMSAALGGLWFTYYARDWTKEALADWAGVVALLLGTGWLLVVATAIEFWRSRVS